MTPETARKLASALESYLVAEEALVSARGAPDEQVVALALVHQAAAEQYRHIAGCARHEMLTWPLVEALAATQGEEAPDA